MLTHAADLVRGGWRFATGLRGFLRVTVDLDEAKAILVHQLRGRELTFLRVLELGIYANANSPYRRLLQHAGFEYEDVRSLIQQRGLDGALSDLHDAGVYVTLDEFKGRVPIRRPGLEFEVPDSDFDNPLLTAHYEARTGGSRSGGTRVPFDFDFLAYEGAGALVDLHAHGIADRPLVLCQAVPPSAQGLSNLLRMARGGHMPVKWFSTSRPAMTRQGLQGRALLVYSLVASRLARRPIPAPEFLREGEMDPVVKYLAEIKRRDRPAVVYSIPGQAVRVCLAAQRLGEDISGTTFYGGGEPYTEGKAAVLKSVGADGVPHYGMNEIGRVSMRCGLPCGPDDMHVMTAKVSVHQRPHRGASGDAVQALFYTSLLTSSPKLMLNVESGDYGVMEERDCGCLWQSLGFTTHVQSVHSYEKLSSEGVMFMGSMLFEILERTLPARFGGNPTDYQLVEEEEGGLPRVRLLISPRVGPLDESAVVEAFFAGIGFSDWSRRMSDEWRRAGTLRIERREPYFTAAAKILPLHVISSQRVSAGEGPPPDSP